LAEFASDWTVADIDIRGVAMDFDDDLPVWSTISDRFANANLLLGNGSSIAVSPDFRYSSLHARATLTTTDQAVFTAADTTNFEEVLRHLRQAGLVCDAFGHDPDDARESYDRVQRALFSAVRRVHPDWGSVPETTLTRIERALAKHDMIYTTNYDLLAYWAIMSREPRIKDFFWNPGGEFDALNVGRGSSSCILYLHGALHLFQDPRTGGAGKRTAAAGNLLQQGRSKRAGTLLVSEATSQEKLRSIRQSDYLSFAYRELADDSGSLVVFGHSLGEQDRHLVDVIDDHHRRLVAVSVMPGRRRKVIRAKLDYTDALPNQTIHFFDATTHPLGDPALRLP
jgi:hypothetical protein